MALGDVTREAVESALLEFDELGRVEFLRRYKFGKSRSYFVERDGNRYDSKAIAGVAHAFLAQGSHPLKSSDFAGGERTTAQVLKRLGFTVINTKLRNPDWVSDELILALDFYLKFRNQLPDKASPQIATLSKEINAIGLRLGLAGDETFRNPNGVYMKLMNFRRLDPQYTANGKVGLQRGGKGEEYVWAAFAGTPERLGEVAEAIRNGLINDEQIELEDAVDLDIAEAQEGRLLTRFHRTRERDRKLVSRKKADFARKNGRVFCEACGFDFHNRYGERGEGFIECHHINPIHTLRPGDRTRLTDLRLLCANCHRMVHTKTRWLTFEELKALLAEHGGF